MKTVEITISDELSMRLQLIRDAKRFPGTLAELIMDMASLSKLEEYTDEEFQKALKMADKRYLEREHSKQLGKYPLQAYILKEYKNGNTQEICWRTCPVHEVNKLNPVSDLKDHIGEFWYCIEVVDSSGTFREIKTSTYHFRKTLKALKRAINKEFGYDHYLVGKKKK